MYMRASIVSWLAALLALGVGTAAFAEGGVTPNQLSDAEKASVGFIIGELQSKSADSLKIEIVKELDKIRATGKSGDAVIYAIKAGAGSKLSLFQNVLTNACVQDKLKNFCAYAAVQPPQQSNEIRTASTGTAGGDSAGGDYSSPGGGGGSIGGHNSESYTSSAFQVPSSDQIFSFGVNSAPPTYFANSPGTQVTVIKTVTVPSPTTGAGLPTMGAAIMLFLAWRLFERRYAQMRAPISREN